MGDDILDKWQYCVLNNVEVKEVNNQISLGGQLFSKDLETTFPVKTPKQQQGKGRKFYTVGEVFFFVENHGLTHVTYVQKAAEKNIGSVRRPDRKALLSRLSIGSCRPMLRSSKSVIEDNNADSPPKKIKTSKTTVEGNLEKPRVKTYSRKKPLPFSRSSPKRPSVASQDQPPANSTNHSLCDLSTLQEELQTQQRVVGSMTIFLRDFLGMTPSQLQLLQHDQYNPSELKRIATLIQSQCPCSCNCKKTQNSLRNSYNEDERRATKFCYKAEKHPTRGWEIVKKDLFAVVNGYNSNYDDICMDDESRAALEICLSKTAIPLKHALSVLISQMREFNKSPTSFEKVDLFCQKIVKDCLVSAVDSFRDAFESLFKCLKGSSEGDIVEKWVTVCEAELKKLLLSLVKSLQTLRDIPPSNSRHLPSTLFQFPEPVFSMALNPAKVTHSVVLELYIQMGLAELRQIISSSVNSSENSYANENHCSEIDSPSYTTSLNLPDIKQEQDVSESLLTDPLSNDVSSEGVEGIVTSSSEEVFHLKNPPSSSLLVSSSPASHSAPELDKLVPEVNGKQRSEVSKHTSCQTRRSSESDSCHYSMFKASLGNTMVSSFKKQIQEKIQAGNIHYGWN